MNLSLRLQELREKKGYSQEQLAERLGISRQAISKWENEQANPDFENLIRLSKLYNTSIDYIVTGNDTTIGAEDTKDVKVQTWKYSDIFKVFLTMFGVMGVGYLATLLAKLLIGLGS